MVFFKMKLVNAMEAMQETWHRDDWAKKDRTYFAVHVNGGGSIIRMQLDGTPNLFRKILEERGIEFEEVSGEETRRYYSMNESFFVTG